jgi:hypothetical protein
MKTIRILIFISIMWLGIACNHASQPDISGIYVTTYHNEFSTGNDTLVINLYNSGTYEVDRKTGYHKIREGKQQPIEFKCVKWACTYDKIKQVLQETEYGRQIYLGKNQQSLLFAGVSYHRLK